MFTLLLLHNSRNVNCLIIYIVYQAMLPWLILSTGSWNCNKGGAIEAFASGAIAMLIRH